jgi:hypothetical protein
VVVAHADLFTSVIHPPVAPEGRAEPRLWIRRLAIFKDPPTIIRDVWLKPGLNIIWTPDMSNSGSRALAHGSGKTTFCRLLRACLGEPGHATDTQRSRLMARLPNGLVAAEILIDGKSTLSKMRSLGDIERAIRRRSIPLSPASSSRQSLEPRRRT